jgi:phosphohistidine phosphatase
MIPGEMQGGFERTMRLYLMRHAKAEPISLLYNRDHLRPLTPEAMEFLEQAAPRMRDAMGVLDRVFSSPLLRARQTAAMILDAYGVERDPIVEAKLDGTADPDVLAGLLPQLMDVQSVLMVGHAPNLDELIAYLVAPTEQSAFTRMSAGSLACIEVDVSLTHKGTLLWLIPLEAW